GRPLARSDTPARPSAAASPGAAAAGTAVQRTERRATVPPRRGLRCHSPSVPRRARPSPRAPTTSPIYEVSYVGPAPSMWFFGRRPSEPNVQVRPPRRGRVVRAGYAGSVPRAGAWTGTAFTPWGGRRLP